MSSNQVSDLLQFQFFDLLPLWAIFLLTVVVFFLAAAGGYQLSKVMQRRSPDRAEGMVGALNGATLGLLAFLLAFVTGSALNNFAARRQAVVSEANAIGTTYLRAGYLTEPYGTESRQLLREYLAQRLAAVDINQTTQAIARSEEIQNELWSRAEQLAKESPSPTTALYISSLNEVIDLHTERINVALVTRLPLSILRLLYLMAILALVLVGLHAGYGEKWNPIALGAFVLTLAVVFLLIADLRLGQSGVLQVSYQSMIDLQRQIGAP